MEADDLCDSAIFRAEQSIEFADRMYRYELSQPCNLPTPRRPIVVAE